MGLGLCQEVVENFLSPFICEYNFLEYSFGELGKDVYVFVVCFLDFVCKF